MRPSILNTLFADITTLKGVGPKVAALITKVSGARLVDLIMTLPSGLIDRSHRPTVAQARPGALVTMQLEVTSHNPPSNKKQPYRVICSDETGFVELIFFRPRTDYLSRALSLIHI